MEKAVSIQSMFTGTPFYERFAKAKRAGFGLVEFGDWTKLDLSRVTEELSGNSLRLNAMTGADKFSLITPDAREAFLEYLSQSIAVAKSFGCKNLIIQSADRGLEPAEPPASPAESADFTGRAAAAQTLMEAAEQAERAGVLLFLKPASVFGPSFAYLHTNSSAGSLVKVINSPALRLLFDFDLTRRPDETAASTFAKYQTHIGHVHIGDSGLPPAPGDVCDVGALRRIREVLADELHYDGMIGFVFNDGGKEDVCFRSIASVFG